MQHQPSAIPTAHRFFEMGEAFIARSKAAGRSQCQAIRPGDPEWSAWETYFRRHLRWTPAAMRMVLRGDTPSMTVPCQWPEWLDDSYQTVAA